MTCAANHDQSLNDLLNVMNNMSGDANRTRALFSATITFVMHTLFPELVGEYKWNESAFASAQRVKQHEGFIKLWTKTSQ